MKTERFVIHMIHVCVGTVHSNNVIQEQRFLVWQALRTVDRMERRRVQGVVQVNSKI